MPFHLPFSYPYFPNFNKYTYPITNKPKQSSNDNVKETEDSINRNNTYSTESSECFFEIFGLKLYYGNNEKIYNIR